MADARYAPLNTKGYATKPAELAVTLTELRNKTTNEQRQIFAFSEHELNEITKALQALKTKLRWWRKTDLINVRPYAKRWAKQAHRTTRLKKRQSMEVSTRWISSFELAGYELPKNAWPG